MTNVFFLIASFPAHQQIFFSDKEYLIGDSAYSNSAYMVPAYKKFGGQVALTAGQNF